MKNIVQGWRNLSVFKKLYGVVGLMAMLIAIELFTMLFAMDVLSSVRAFVGGEGSWSKAQKDSIQSLYRYAITSDRNYYIEFQNHLKVNYGDRQARQELQGGSPNMANVFEGFKQGNIHPQDIPGLVRVLQRFHEISYVNRAIKAWMAADENLDELVIAAAQLDTAISVDRSPEKVKEALATVEDLNANLTILENEFSSVLSEGSRWLEGVLRYLLIFAVLVVESTSIFLTYTFAKNLSSSIKEMTRVAERVGAGDFSQRIPLKSRDELGQLSQTINRMTEDLQHSIGSREKAESESKIKSLFLANMSHEIRTPLGVILGLTEALKQPGIGSEQQQKFIQTIDRTGQDLKQIINDILDISKIEAGRLDIEKSEFVLNGFLSDLYDSLKMNAAKYNNRLEFKTEGSLPGIVYSDRIRLRQILLNLLGNSLKFTRHGRVSLKTWYQDGMLHFQIEDTGIGIKPEQAKLLFQPFSQGDSSTTRKHGGTGLGLFLSLQLARRLGGDITLEKSIPDEGSMFLVKVQGDLESAGPHSVSVVPENQEVALKAFNGKRVLVVDDSEDNQMVLQFFLKQRGIAFEAAYDGSEALEKVKQHSFDLILMDIQMPIMDGHTATKNLRDSGFNKPIIALTAHAMKSDQERCIQSGCTDYLTKPLDMTLFQKMLVRHLR